MNIRELCDAFDLDSYIVDRGGVQVQSGEWLLVCPVCQKRKLAVNLRKRVWHCWVCEEYGPPDLQSKRRIVKGAGGVLQLVMLLEGATDQQALHFINTHKIFQPTSLDTVDFSIVVEHEISPQPIPYPDWWNDVDAMLPYMVERGITLEDAKFFRIGWCSGGRYANRLMFPVYEHGRLMYYQGRAMWQEQLGSRYIKTLNPPKMEASVVSSEVLMNLDQACRYERVCVTEGPIDCVHVGPDAVCSFGKRLHPIQIRKLIESGVKKLDLMWDGPSDREPHGAWPEMFQAARQLTAIFDVRLVFLPHGDPGDYPREQLHMYRAQARSPDYLFGMVL